MLSGLGVCTWCSLSFVSLPLPHALYFPCFGLLAQFTLCLMFLVFWSLHDENCMKRNVSYRVPINKTTCSMLALCWAVLGTCSAMMGRCWAYVEACWPFWAHVGPMVCPFWAHFGRMLAHVERRFGTLDLPILGTCKKRGKQDSRAKMPRPQS